MSRWYNWAGSIVLAGVAIAAAPAHADQVDERVVCAPGVTPVAPISDRLPVNQNFSDRDLARFALPYAQMISDATRRWRDNLEPYGFVRGEDSTAVFAEIGDGAMLSQIASGFYGTTFFHCREKAIVVAIRSVEFYDLRDFLGALDRQIASGEAEPALVFFDAIRARYPDYSISVTGHSSAGGIASWVGAVRSVPTVVFDATRTDASLSNDGRDQLAVRVAGDVLSDPDATAPPGIMRMVESLTDREEVLSGTELEIEPVNEALFTLQLHWSGFLIRELELLAD